MNINNIRAIQGSKLWKKIINNKFYRGHLILDSQRKPDNQRTEGFFFLLLVFFDADVSDKTLNRYRDEGAKVSKGENLDCIDPYKFYGTIKMLRFS